MKFTPTSLPEVQLITPRVFSDQRGFFMETFQARHFSNAGLPTAFVQDNYAGSYRGTLRGLHYQIRQAQGKLIRVVSGEIFDVAVDLRRESPTFKKWVGVVLTASSHQQLWLPPGFAHGYYVLSDWAEIIYKATDYYAPEWERCLLWNDSSIGIEWPLLDGEQPILSPKDRLGKTISQAQCYDDAVDA